MREIEMRQRIEGFLKRRMQGMLAPALGLGLAVVGCERTTATPVYSAPNPDAPIGHVEDAPGLTHDALVDSAAKLPDAYTADALAKDTNVPADGYVPSDVALGDVVLADVATVPDARRDSSSEAGSGGDAIPAADAGTGVDSGADLGTIITKYMAQLPDAGRDLGAMPLYMAPLYMASVPLG